MPRTASVSRTTKETSIECKLNLDGSGACQIHTGIGFLDHMLEQLAFHGLVDLDIQAKGDLHIDSHHTVEDIAIVLGQAVQEALGDRKGIVRYAHAYIPMDEALLRAALDVSGRPDFVFHGQFQTPSLGQLDTQLISHFFKSFTQNAKITLHLSILYGDNDHHCCEGLFKALARALCLAVQLDPRRTEITSTKGVL